MAWVRPAEEGAVGAGEGHTRGVGLKRPTSVGHHGGVTISCPFSVSPAELVLFSGVSSLMDGQTASPPTPQPPGGPFMSSPPPSLHIQGNLLNFPPSDVALLAWQVNGFSLNISYLLVFCYSTTLIFKNFLTLPNKPDNPVLPYMCFFLS